jgi:hypothetical protein
MLAYMNFHMSVQVARFSERLVALITFIRLLIVVSPHMNLEDVISGKFTKAHLTFIWLLKSMLTPYMVLKMSICSKTTFARLALKVLNVIMAV